MEIKSCCFLQKKSRARTKKKTGKNMYLPSNRRHLPILDPRRIHVPRALPEVSLVLRVPALEPNNLRVALEGQDVRREAVEEPGLREIMFFFLLHPR